MNDTNLTVQPERVRVSIFERIVPLAAFGLAAAAGGIGGLWIILLMHEFSMGESVDIYVATGFLVHYMVTPFAFLLAAAALGAVGICVAIGRMVITTSTASPSGVSYIVLGIFSLIPVGLLWNAVSIMMNSLTGASEYNIGMIGATVAERSAAAVIITPVVLLVLLAWAVIPFKARPGRRFGPLITLVVMECVLVAVALMMRSRLSEFYEINMAS